MPDPFGVPTSTEPPQYVTQPPSGLVEHRLDRGTVYTCLRCGWEHRWAYTYNPTGVEVEEVSAAHHAVCAANHPHVIRSGPTTDYASPACGCHEASLMLQARITTLSWFLVGLAILVGFLVVRDFVFNGRF